MQCVNNHYRAIMETLGERGHFIEKKDEYQAKTVAFSCHQVMALWLNDSERITKEELADVMCSFVPAPLLKAFDTPPRKSDRADLITLLLSDR